MSIICSKQLFSKYICNVMCRSKSTSHDSNKKYHLNDSHNIGLIIVILNILK